MRYAHVVIFSFFSIFAVADTVLFDSSIETPHLKIYWNKGNTTNQEVDSFKEEAEIIFGKITTIYKTQIKVSPKLTITLNGDGRIPGQEMKTPFTDPEAGWMHLFRFRGAAFAYQNGLSHEMSHAYRFQHIKKHEVDKAAGFGFLEEGLAEYVSTLVEPNKTIFSTYGVSLTVAAGNWRSRKEEIPLQKLLTQFGNLDQKCMVQAYTLRSSFIEFLDQTYGREKLLEISFFDKPIDANAFKFFYGKDFTVLVKDWEDWLDASIPKLSDFKTLSDKYNQAVVQKGMYVCQRGRDF